MRIAFVSTILGYPWGSPDRLWCDLAARCQSRGDQVFLGISSQTADHDAVRALERHGARLFLRDRNSVFLGRMDQWLRRLPSSRSRHIDLQLGEFHPDVVVITQGGAYDVIAESYLLRWLEGTGTPSIVICHNNREDSRPAAEEIAPLRRFFDSASALLFVSSHNLACAERHLEHPLPRARLIQNPLAIGDTGQLAWPSGDIPQLGMVGRIDIHHKGIDLLLEALSSLKAEHSFALTLTGRCDDPAALVDLIRRHSLQERVSVLPPVAGNGIARSYEALECFMLPSRYEGCASSMVESLMCGRPVLASPVGGVSDWIEDGSNGFVASEPSVPAIRETLHRALSRRDAWRRMGIEARKSFEAHRDPDPVSTLHRLVDGAALPAALKVGGQ